MEREVQGERGPLAAPAQTFDVIGRNLTRVDAAPKADGSPVFGADLRFPRALYAAALVAPVASGRIRRLDVSRARALKGVAAVAAARDIPGVKRYGPAIADQPVLVEERIHCAADVIALVAAESKELAEEAIRLIRLEVEELPAVFSPKEALAEGAPLVHEDHPRRAGGNLLAHYKIRKGEVGRGFAEADVVVENTFRTQMVDHAYLEPDVGAAVPEGDGTLTYFGPTQCPHMVRRLAAQVLAMDQGRIRVVGTPPGGAFGGKEDSSFEIAMRAGLLARMTGRPVIYEYPREESLGARAKRIPVLFEHKLGAKRTGQLTALELKVYLDKGPYATSGGGPPPPASGIIKKLSVHASGPYEIPNIWIDSFNVFTNNPPTASMRGLGVPQVHFATESQMDELARILGMDPFELRRKNGLRVGSRTATGQTLEQSVGLLPCLDKLEEALRAAGPPAPPSGPTKRRGRGLAAFWYSTGTAQTADACGANAYLSDDGKLQLAVGIIEMGQGSHTVLSQIAAEALGVPLEDVRIVPVDTSSVPESGYTAGSRSTTIPGNAVFDAVRELKEELRAVAAELLEAAPADIVLRGGRAHVAGHPERSLTLAEVARACRMRGRRLSGQGFFSTGPLTFDPETGQGRPFMVYSYGAQVAEVEVDLETGEVAVTRFFAAHDVGRAINPRAVEGQVEGGIAMGLGQALIEEVVLDRGRILTPDLARYEIPCSPDAPEVQCIIVEEPNATGPFGAKGVGESALVPTLAAIANAVREAAGVRIRELPITAERVALALRRTAR